MKKILDLLEQKVQWVVLGLALLYAGWVTYSYVITPKVVVKIGDTDVVPGDIDKETLLRVGDALDAKMRDTRIIMPATAPSYVAEFQSKMSYDRDKNATWADAAVVVQQLPMYKIDLKQAVDPNQNNNPVPKNTTASRVADLIKLPAAKIGNSPRIGLSSVVPPGIAPAALVNNPGVDKSWVTIRFEIDPKELAAAWDTAKIPDGLAGNTEFFQVTMERQELGADGKWTTPTAVPGLPHIQLQAVPKNDPKPAESTAFEGWAKAHQRDILQPDFYQIVKGDQWAVPGVELANAGPAQPVFRAEDHVGDKEAQLMKLTQEQRKEVAALKAKLQQQNRPAPQPRARGRATPAPAPAPAPTDAPQFNFGADTSSERPISFQAADPNAPAPVDAQPAPEGEGQNAPAAQQGNFPMPSGQFDPHKWTSTNANIPNIVGWAHDETATPGRIYRYRIVYTMKNPVFSASGFAKNPADEKVFSIVSVPSEWTPNVKISSTVNFFIARRGGMGNSVMVDVFRKQGGQVNKKSFDVGAGDMIGSKDNNGVDYSTGITLVDLREDPRTGELYVLLMDQSGSLARRDFAADAKDELYKQLQQQAAPAAAAGRVDDVASR